MSEEDSRHNHVMEDEDDAFMDSLVKRLQAAAIKQPRRHPHIIYRVPQSIRESDNDAYEPKVISIGPYHRGKERLQAMEECKLNYLHTILSGSTNKGKSLGEFIKEIRAMEDQARCCYSEKINLSSDEFVEMMLLDSCFIVQLFLNLQRKEAVEEDLVYSTNWMLPLISLDMLLLENQIPFFVLQRVFDLVYESNSGFLVELALTFFDHLLPRNEEIAQTKPVHHLLHLFHAHLLPSPSIEKLLPLGRIDLRPAFSNRSLLAFEHKPPLLPKSIPSAQEIRRAGIKFRRKKNANSFLDMKMSKDKIIEIPTISIYESTNCLFRNLIALEQCYPKCGIHFTSYAVFMSCILEMTKDVMILKQNRIMEHWLENDEEVVLLFSRMCKGIALDFESNYLSGVFKKVASICESDWNTWRATLIRDYFSSPWSILQVEATVLALVFTLVQTFLAVLAYYRPRR